MRYVLLALIVLCSGRMQAQLNGKYIFNNIGVKDGLLHSTVLDIGQDENGFMWIVTPNGLQRYDGHRFVNYPQFVNYPLGRSEKFSKLIIDTTNKKVNVVVIELIESLDLTTNTISTLTIADLPQDSPFVFTTKDYQRNLITSYAYIRHLNDTFSETYIFSDRERNRYLIRDSVSGDLFIPMPYDFGVMRKGSDSVELKSENSDHPLLTQLAQLERNFAKQQDTYEKKVYIRFTFLDSHRSLWIITWNEYLLRYDLRTQQLHYYDIEQLREDQIPDHTDDPVILVNQVFEDRQRQVWMAIDNAGIVHYDREKDGFQFITADARIRNGLEFSLEVGAIFQDRDDNIWVGTDRGISIFNPYRNQVQVIRHQDGNPGSLPKIDILDIIETSEGEILVGSWGGGITVFDRQWNFQRQVAFAGGVHPNQVWCFVQHDDGTIWAGSQGGYIHIYDPVRRTFRTIRPPETGYNTIMYMEKDRNGDILMGLPLGYIAIWRKTENKFYPYNRNADSHYVYSHLFNGMYIDEQNHCWASFNFGLMKFDQQKGMYAGIYRIPGENTLGRNTLGIESYNDSMLLVGTDHAGLQLFNKRTQTFTRFMEKQLSEYATVNAIRKDEEGNIWFTTQFDLYHINAQSEVSRLDLGHMADISALMVPWFHRLSDGRLVTSSGSEVVCFNPGGFGSSSSPVDVQISGFKLFGEDIHIDSFLAYQKPVILDHRQNFFSIEFANLHFHDVRTTTYYYRLSDVDPDWVRTETPIAEYTAIRPGEYVFEVKAEQGNEFSTVASFPIIINSPWWATWWFRSLSFVLLVALVYFLIRKRIQLIRKEAGLKHLIAETKMMALRSQMNPHFIFNCLNTIDNMIQSDQKDKATTYLAKFAKLMRAILENSKSNVIPCWKDIEALELYLDMENLRWDHKINYQIHIGPRVKEGDYKIPPMVIQPFVENAIHHGLLNKKSGDKNLAITVELEGEVIKYTIADNGVGRHKAAEYKMLNRSSQPSFGIQITKDRIEMFNQHQNRSVAITDLFNEQHEPSGTLVEVWLSTQLQPL